MRRPSPFCARALAKRRPARHTGAMSERDERNREQTKQSDAGAVRLSWPATLPPPSKHPPHVTTKGSILPVATR